MNDPIGFIILVNPNNPLEQTSRLIQTLNRMFGYPPIACHQDFGQNSSSIPDLPTNVQIALPHFATSWGQFSCVEAMIKCLSLLYPKTGCGPEWFVYLSGADYPVKSASQILADLQSNKFDGYIEHRLVSKHNLSYPHDLSDSVGWKGNFWLKLCHKRYCSWRLDIHGINRYLRFSRRTLWLDHPIFTRGRLPFKNNIKCYAGEAWFCANRKCARRILDFYENEREVANHYRKTLVPEESYLHTILANDPALKLSQNHLRYVDWSNGGSNPKFLTNNDLPKITRSSAHFARKFDMGLDSYVLDKIDKLIG